VNPGLETWPGHFRHRIHELEEILEYWPKKKVGRALELGCGNGLAAIFFSRSAETIVATDLPNVDHDAHSVGLELAREFFRQMKLENTEVLGCSAESIPLPDHSFDLVYGIYCLEHIPDRAAALGEMRRVLVNGGEVLLTVPGFAWSLVYPFGFYTGLASRIAGRIFSRFGIGSGKSSAEPAAGATAISAPQSKVTGFSSFRRYYPRFPFPEPHGTHASWLAELIYYRPANWIRLMEDNGFRDVRLEPMGMLPGELKAILPSTWSLRLETWLKHRKFARGWAQYYCIRASAP
jgi:SAM-dependent methyltransferase